MKFIRYACSPEATPALGLLSPDEARILPLHAVPGMPAADTMIDFIAAATDAHIAALREALRGGEGWIPREGARLLAPIDRPIHDIICVGVNYLDHREESRRAFDTSVQQPETVYFGKRAIGLLGPGEAVHSRLDLDESLDYEVELAVIIGRRGVDIPAGEAESYIFGYSVFNDISARTVQHAHLQWYRGKSLDTYAAMGPCILHRSALPFPVAVDVQSRVNGEVRQRSNTKLLIADIPTIIAEMSRGITLEPGDIIATGTPAGVGAGFMPPRFLHRGDTVACEIPPIGVLENPIA